MSLPPNITVIKMSRLQNAKGEVLLQFIAILSVFLRRQALSITLCSASYKHYNITTVLLYTGHQGTIQTLLNHLVIFFYQS